MRYAIISFRTINDQCIIGYKDTIELATQAVDHLAWLQYQKRRDASFVGRIFSAAEEHYSFLPFGEP